MWKHLFPKGKRLRSEQLRSWKIYSLGTVFDICLPPLFFPLLSSRVHYQICALSPVTREQSNIQHSSICNKITNNVQLKPQGSHPWRRLFTLKVQAGKELGYKPFSTEEAVQACCKQNWKYMTLKSLSLREGSNQTTERSLLLLMPLKSHECAY